MGTLLQVLGAVGISVGLWMIWPPLGVVFGGFLLVAFGVAIARNNAG
jgi:hypothetical protein